jgi:hypothetical protein
METVCFSKTLASTYESTWCHNPGENTVIFTTISTLNPSPVFNDQNRIQAIIVMEKKRGAGRGRYRMVQIPVKNGR